MSTADYNSGTMPGTDLRYEDFEAFLASFAVTFACLEKSTRFSDPKDYAAIIEILDGFADRYRVQRPRQAIAMPRRKRASFPHHRRRKATPTSAFYDNSYVNDLKQSGFLDSVWK